MVGKFEVLSSTYGHHKGPLQWASQRSGKWKAKDHMADL